MTVISLKYFTQTVPMRTGLRITTRVKFFRRLLITPLPNSKILRYNILSAAWRPVAPVCSITSVSRSGIARRRRGVIHSSGAPQQLRKDRFQCIRPDLIRLHVWMEFVFRVHHPVEQPSIAVGQFVVDIQISDLLAISELRQTAVDPVDEGNERHIVVPREDPHYYDCRRGRLLLNHVQNRLKTSRKVVCFRVGSTWGR